METTLEIDRLKNKVQIIEEFIGKYAGLHDIILQMKQQVEGGAEFRETFEENVEKIVKTILSNSENLKALQEISNEQIKTFNNSADFQEQIKKLVIETLENEVNNSKSNTNISIKDIVTGKLTERDRKLLLWFVLTLIGSIGTIFSIYKFVVS